jgi:hypothetical protein
MKITKIYMVTGFTAEYDDFELWNVCGFLSQKKAQDHINKLNQWLKEHKIPTDNSYCCDIRSDDFPECPYDKQLKENYREYGITYCIEEVEILETPETPEEDNINNINYKKLLIRCLEQWIDEEGCCWDGEGDKTLSEKEAKTVMEITEKLGAEYDERVENNELLEDSDERNGKNIK